MAPRRDVGYGWGHGWEMGQFGCQLIVQRALIRAEAIGLLGGAYGQGKEDELGLDVRGVEGTAWAEGEAECWLLLIMLLSP